MIKQHAAGGHHILVLSYFDIMTNMAVVVLTCEVGTNYTMTGIWTKT